MSLVKMYAPAGAGGMVQATYSGTVTIGSDGSVFVDPRDCDALVIAGFSFTTGVPGVANFRNLIDGGDFTVNPWQRGASFSSIANTLTYTADRWFAVGGASSSISVSQQAITAIPAFGDALQFGRGSGSNTAAINLGQVLESADSIRCQGQQITLSFWALAGANFSGSGLGVELVSGTGNNQSAASMVAGSWTGQANVINQAQGLSSSWQRYSFTGTVPAACTQLGLLFSYTPTGSAGASDFVQIAGVQLELGNVAGPFEHRDIQVELEICQRYAYVVNEPGSGAVVAAGMNTSASAQQFYLALPVQMRVAPTVTVASSGTFKTNQAGTATSTTVTAGSTHTVNAITLDGNSSGTSGQATLLQGGGGSGQIVVSADF